MIESIDTVSYTHLLNVQKQEVDLFARQFFHRLNRTGILSCKLQERSLIHRCV